MNYELLLVEDDQEISELLSELLTREGFHMSAAYDGEKGLMQALENDYDVVILDIMLPKLDGLEVLRSLRKKKNTPVLMLTARGDDIDRIIGFEMGADDYLPKPFNPRELIARLKAILRRIAMDNIHLSDNTASSVLSNTFSHRPKIFKQQDLEIHSYTRQVFIEKKAIDLTGAEYNILAELVRQQGVVVKKTALTERALGRKQTLYDRAIDMHLSNLRKKLGKTPKGQERIITVRGVGYLFPENEP